MKRLYDGTYEEWLEEWEVAIDEARNGNPENAWELGGYLVRTAHEDWDFRPILSKVGPLTDYAKANGLLLEDSPDPEVRGRTKEEALAESNGCVGCNCGGNC